MEEQLGSNESSPSGAVRDMFNSKPTVRVCRSVAGFLYGNGVNVSDAVKLYRTCNNAWKAIAETHVTLVFPLGQGCSCQVSAYVLLQYEEEMCDVDKEGRACEPEI